ncbi:MAG: single-stranded DNA-binding protein [Solirubrobacterales bacterium]|nr:single-stranded DNA-binding protein [Solirubrobacterales bacterium]
MNITVTGVGRLTADPALKATPSGKSVAELRIAADRRDRDADPVYVDLVAWEGLAETVAEHLAKGRQIAFRGRLDYREWQTDDGAKRSKHEVVAEEIEFLSRPKKEDAENGK